jgi:hypothetical protein
MSQHFTGVYLEGFCRGFPVEELKDQSVGHFPSGSIRPGESDGRKPNGGRQFGDVIGAGRGSA